MEKGFYKRFLAGFYWRIFKLFRKKNAVLNQQEQDNIYARPAKILHAAAFSIRENAARDELFLQNWSIDYGLVRFDFSFDKKRKFKARLLPEAVVAIVLSGAYGKFDLVSTLSTGNLIFSRNSFISNSNTALGITFGRSSVYVDNPQYGFNKHRIIAHAIGPSISIWRI